MIGPVEILPVLRADAADCGLGIVSIEAWPAAGGGLLVGMAEAEFAGAAPLRRKVKTIFITIDAGATTLLLPYVSLENEAQRCIRTLVAVELQVPEESVALRSLEDARHRIVDVCTEAERGLQACAAVARTLLVAAAAELWAVPAHRCGFAAGLIVGPESGQIVERGDVAADAALLELPDSVRLFSGRSLSLRASAPTPRSRRRHRYPAGPTMDLSLHT
jgi:isoquinoline 1-oxidoreductase beta subunit